MASFGSAAGVQGTVVSADINELIFPNDKHTWGAIRKKSNEPAAVRRLSFKSMKHKAQYLPNIVL